MNCSEKEKIQGCTWEAQNYTGVFQNNNPSEFSIFAILDIYPAL